MLSCMVRNDITFRFHDVRRASWPAVSDTLLISQYRKGLFIYSRARGEGGHGRAAVGSRCQTRRGLL